MAYKLFLDDIRFPNERGWVIARSMDDAIWYVENNGIPEHIAFDHDLADAHYIVGATHEKTGYDFAKWFVLYCFGRVVPVGFSYSVHSMNPVGAANIEHVMHNFMVSLDSQKKT